MTARSAAASRRSHVASNTGQPASRTACTTTRVVVDDDADRAVPGQLLQLLELEADGRAAVPLGPHDDGSAADAGVVEPRLGVGPQVGRPTGQVDDVVVLGQPGDDGQALGVGRIGAGGGEEPGPVLAPALEVAQPVADVGDDAVEVDDGQRPGLVRHVAVGTASLEIDDDEAAAHVVVEHVGHRAPALLAARRRRHDDARRRPPPRGSSDDGTK